MGVAAVGGAERSVRASCGTRNDRGAVCGGCRLLDLKMIQMTTISILTLKKKRRQVRIYATTLPWVSPSLG